MKKQYLLHELDKYYDKAMNEINRVFSDKLSSLKHTGSFLKEQ